MNSKKKGVNPPFKHMQNPFYKAHTLTELKVKKLRNLQFYKVLVVLTVILTLIVTPIVLSYIGSSITIKNSGKILTAKPLIIYKSEIRGVFIHEAIWGCDWNVVAQTLAQYGINAVFVNDQGGLGRRPDNDIRFAIDAFHAYGIEYHSCISVLQETKPENSLGTEAIKHDGSVYFSYSHCPIKAHDYILSNIQNYLETFPDVDGIMLDYIRYDSTDMCYCEHCRAAFEEWLGEGEITDWSPFYPEGSRHIEFLEWRNIPVTQLVKDIHDTVKSINPNILISEAAWTYFSDCPTYWRKFLGQDTGRWIAEGYIDFVCPMMYTKEIYGENGETLESEINANLKYMTGGVEGKIPLVALLRCDVGEDSPTPDEFKAEIDYVRSRGLDGWVIWRYSGPGGQLSGSPDITQYLKVIDMPETFSLSNVKVAVNENSATITWKTELPTTSIVEYNTTPLFNASKDTWGNFHYWNITRTQAIVITDNQNVTEHNITLTGLLPGTEYYFRVQSKGISGTATSKVMTFTIP